MDSAATGCYKERAQQNILSFRTWAKKPKDSQRIQMNISGFCFLLLVFAQRNRLTREVEWKIGGHVKNTTEYGIANMHTRLLLLCWNNHISV